MSAISRHVPSDEFLEAPAAPLGRVRWRPGAAFLLATAQPRVNTGAWFALALAVPVALLALAAGMTQAGAPRVAGLLVALLLAPAAVLALRSLEIRQGEPTPAETRDQDLKRAFCLTTGQACGFLCTVILGAPFSHEAVAVGLAMAGMPLGLAVVSDVWRRVFRPLDERVAPPVKAWAGRNWTLEWAQAQTLAEPNPAPLTALPPVVQPPARADAPVKLRIAPVAPDEAWMQRYARRPLPLRQTGGGWISGSTQPRRPAGANSAARV